MRGLLLVLETNCKRQPKGSCSTAFIKFHSKESHATVVTKYLAKITNLFCSEVAVRNFHALNVTR